jgi:thioesterase-3
MKILNFADPVVSFSKEASMQAFVVPRRETIMAVSLKTVVRSTEIDVNGHVNNAKYLEYLEWGREEFYEQAGLHYHVLLEMGVQTVTANININYRREAVQGDELTILTWPGRLGRSSYVLHQKIINQRGEIVADAQVTMVTIDRHTRKSTPVPEALARLIAPDPKSQTHDGP